MRGIAIENLSDMVATAMITIVTIHGCVLALALDENSQSVNNVYLFFVFVFVFT